jgi:hypothetical protein
MKHALPMMAVLAGLTVFGQPIAARADQTATAWNVAAAYDFETSADALAWQDEKHPGEAPSILALDPTDPHAGKSSLKLAVEGDPKTAHDAWCRLSLKDPVPGRRLAVDFTARTSPRMAGKASFRVLEFASRKPIHWIDNVLDLVPISGGPAWTKYHGEAALTEKTDVVFLYVFLAQPKSGDAVWIDDLRVSTAR